MSLGMPMMYVNYHSFVYTTDVLVSPLVPFSIFNSLFCTRRPAEQQLCDACIDKPYDDESNNLRMQRLNRGLEPMCITGSSAGSQLWETNARPIEQGFLPARIGDCRVE